MINDVAANRARVFTLLALAVIVVAFAVTWLSVPTSRTAKVPPPASFFLHGIAHCVKTRYGACTKVSEGGGQARGYQHGLNDLKSRIAVVYGSAAAVVILAGLAFGAARRSAPI